MYIAIYFFVDRIYDPPLCEMEKMRQDREEVKEKKKTVVPKSPEMLEFIQWLCRYLTYKGKDRGRLLSRAQQECVSFTERVCGTVLRW